MDPFAIPIAIFRNAGYSLPVELQEANGTPFPTPGWAFRLEIVPARSDRSWASPPAFAQAKVSGSGESGTVFVLEDSDTASLDFRLAYNWRVLMQQVPLASPCA